MTPAGEARTEGALLICAGGGIGDSLLATVVARALRDRYARVDALALPSHREALVRVPDLDRVWSDDGQSEIALAERLREQRYAAAVVTWATPRTARLAQRAGIPVRVGQARRLYSFRFTHRVVVRSELGDVTSRWSEILLDYARALGCDVCDEGYPRLAATGEDRREAAELLAALASEHAELGSGAAAAFAIVHPTNAVAPVRGIWPSRGWASLVRAVRERFGIPVLVSGSRADAQIAAAIVREGGGIPIAGRTTIGGFAALAERARFFAGITTGSMHVAAAVGCPTVGIFPFQSDFPERWAPHARRAAIVRATYPCHPGDTKENCRDYACIEHLNVPRILAAIDALAAG